MAYKWRPSKTARREFAIKMQDPQEAAAYEARKAEKANKRRATSSFDYNTAGGYYVPTKAQYDHCFEHINSQIHDELQIAFRNVIYGYTCNEKVHHDNIHIVNEHIRSHGKI